MKPTKETILKSLKEIKEDIKTLYNHTRNNMLEIDELKKELEEEK